MQKEEHDTLTSHIPNDVAEGEGKWAAALFDKSSLQLLAGPGFCQQAMNKRKTANFLPPCINDPLGELFIQLAEEAARRSCLYQARYADVAMSLEEDAGTLKATEKKLQIFKVLLEQKRGSENSFVLYSNRF